MKAPIYKGESKAFQAQQDRYWEERNPKKKAIAKKMGGKSSDAFLKKGKELKEKYENKMTRQAIADSNKQHKRGSINYIKSK